MFHTGKIVIFIICIILLASILVNFIDIRKIVSNNLSYPWQFLSFLPTLSANYYLDETKCSVGQILTQANTFQQIFSKDLFWSACYSADYLTMMYLADVRQSNQKNKLFFDIGANKGYTIATWLSMWMPERDINTKSLYTYLSQVLQIKDCGACEDCKESILSHVQRSTTSLEIHAFEPMQSTYQILSQVRTWMNISSLNVHQIAISNVTGLANMQKCPPGGESCGLVLNDNSISKENVFQTQTITLDNFVEQKNITQKIDLLKIDTEGADPLVLQGAKKMFSRKQIRMLIFENHDIGIWKTVSLLNVIEFLDREDFICYMLGKTGLARLTNCWSPVFDVRRWSNVLCIHREEKRLRRFLEPLLITNL